MVAIALRSEERVGLGIAVVAHAALVALLLWRPPTAPVVVPPDRIEVTISTDVGLKSTSPDPMSDARPDTGPEIGDPAPPAPELAPAPPIPRAEPPPPAPAPAPLPKARPEPPKPQPRAEPRPQPRPVPKAVPKAVPPPRPAPRPAARPAPAPVPRPSARPAPPRPAAAPARPAAAPARPSAAPAARPATKAGTTAGARPTTRPGATRVDSNFLAGVPGARAAGASRNPPAQAAGPAVQSSLLGAISREIKPHWQGKAPEGADAELLVTILRWNLNRDGTLAGTPTVVRQEGITDANRAQAQRHAEQAVRAVQLAAPFDLPDQYYDTWKRVTIRFDKRLSQ